MAGFDPTRWIWIQWRGTRASGGAAGCVGGGRRRELNGEPNLGLRCPIRNAGGTYVQHAERRSKLGRQSWRRCGGAGAPRGCAARQGWRSPARFLRRRGHTGSKQTARDGSLPSCVAPGWLTATSRQRRRGKRKRRRLGFCGGFRAWRPGHGLGVPVVVAGL
jgi:hypothetical protein